MNFCVIEYKNFAVWIECYKEQKSLSLSGLNILKSKQIKKACLLFCKQAEI
jgi:hypothetical protein